MSLFVIHNNSCEVKIDYTIWLLVKNMLYTKRKIIYDEGQYLVVIIYNYANSN